MGANITPRNSDALCGNIASTVRRKGEHPIWTLVGLIHVFGMLALWITFGQDGLLLIGVPAAAWVFSFAISSIVLYLYWSTPMPFMLKRFIHFTWVGPVLCLLIGLSVSLNTDVVINELPPFSNPADSLRLVLWNLMKYIAIAALVGLPLIAMIAFGIEARSRFGCESK